MDSTAVTLFPFLTFFSAVERDSHGLSSWVFLKIFLVLLQGRSNSFFFSSLIAVPSLEIH